MKLSTRPFGTTSNGEPVLAYTLENNRGMRAEILNYGAVIRCLEVPDRNGDTVDVVLGYDLIEDYMRSPNWFGAIVGRNANRISGAAVTLDGTRFELERNSGEHNLHSGSAGLSFRLFSSEAHTYNNLPVLLLSHTVEHLSDGFPGTLTVNLTYFLTDDNALMIDARAVSDQPTVINLTNHSYFNLAGHSSGSISDHMLEMRAGFYTPMTPEGIPTGEILRLDGTPLDFQGGRQIGRDIAGSYPQIGQFGGYDHNYVLDGFDYRKVARLTDPASGRMMEVFTDLPGLQLYTANSLAVDGPCKDGAVYGKHQGVCLETQLFPNGVNTPWFPSPVFGAGEEYVSTTAYVFSNEAVAKS